MKTKVKAKAARAVLGGCLLLVSTQASAGECEGVDPQPPECFPRITCPMFEDVWDYRRAVVYLYGPDIDGTGVLLNNTNCYLHEIGCGTPYLLTALHVISDEIGNEPTPGQIASLETETAFSFNYESPFCAGGDIYEVVGVVGAEVVSYDRSKDLLLLRLLTSLPPDLGAYYLGWRPLEVSEGVAIGHSCGADKRGAIALVDMIEYKSVVGRDVLDVLLWEVGALASGASGSPLLDPEEGSLMGIYTNAAESGVLACTNFNLVARDRFTAWSSIYEFLPAGVRAGPTTVPGYDSDPHPDGQLPAIVTSGEYFGPESDVVIAAQHKVYLVPDFHADRGSTVVVEVGP